MNDIENKLQLAMLEIKRLQQENEKLKSELSRYQTDSSLGEPAPTPKVLVEMTGPLPDSAVNSVHHYSSPGDKIRLYKAMGYTGADL